LKNLYSILIKNPKLKDNFSYSDISNLFHYLFVRTGKHKLSDFSYYDIKDYVDKYVFCEPFQFDFYFRIRSDFPSGFQIGNGYLYPYKDLEKDIQKKISNNWESEWKYGYYEERFLDTFEDYKKFREENDSYMHVKLNSIGTDKATEKANLSMQRNLNIYKIIYSQFGHISSHSNITHFNNFYIGIHKMGAVYGGKQIDRNITLFRIELFDNRIKEMNEIIDSINRSELEERIISVIDIMGMINDQIPLEMRYLLCIISLEKLLLYEKDYLGWKLAERISFLLGLEDLWLLTFDNYNEIFTNEELRKDVLPKAKFELNKKIKKLYDKRSSFAHSGKIQNMITPEDFRFAQRLVVWLVELLMNLRKIGIKCIQNQTNDIGNPISLEAHIDRMKLT
jgi:hypothetical protein